MFPYVLLRHPALLAAVANLVLYMPNSFHWIFGADNVVIYATIVLKSDALILRLQVVDTKEVRGILSILENNVMCCTEDRTGND